MTEFVKRPKGHNHHELFFLALFWFAYYTKPQGFPSPLFLCFVQHLLGATALNEPMSDMDYDPSFPTPKEKILLSFVPNFKTQWICFENRFELRLTSVRNNERR